MQFPVAKYGLAIGQKKNKYVARIGKNLKDGLQHAQCSGSLARVFLHLDKSGYV